MLREGAAIQRGGPDGGVLQAITGRCLAHDCHRGCPRAGGQRAASHPLEPVSTLRQIDTHINHTGHDRARVAARGSIGSAVAPAPGAAQQAVGCQVAKHHQAAREARVAIPDLQAIIVDRRGVGPCKGLVSIEGDRVNRPAGR